MGFINKLFRSKDRKLSKSRPDYGYTYSTPNPTAQATYNATAHYQTAHNASYIYEAPQNQSFNTSPPAIPELSPLTVYNQSYSRSPSDSTLRPSPWTPGSSSSSQPNSAGHCFVCERRAPNEVLVRANERSFNPNNGRRYRSCTNNACGSFNGFADDRGINSWNPTCRCKTQSRLVAKKMRNQDTGLWESFFSCQDKGCAFWEAYRDDGGHVQGFSDAQISAMIRRKEI
ncbi:hypothetical protein GQ44DRAFT_727575 [Phaeosphaeriaceae sp. PMI808]|nr:hypothetical protein GQ44DRAFT_727575 [Phaeosphaeriaceae sp. PMI808]